MLIALLVVIAIVGILFLVVYFEQCHEESCSRCPMFDECTDRIQRDIFAIEQPDTYPQTDED